MADSLTKEQQIAYAALADEVYVRSSLDQPLTRSEIPTGYQEIGLTALSNSLSSTDIRRSGEYY